MSGKRTARSNVTELRELLLWARENRIVLGTVVIGDVTVTVTDVGMAAPHKAGANERTASMLASFAGPHADKLREAGLDFDDDGDRAAVQ